MAALRAAAHRTARKLAQGLQAIDASLVDAGAIESNILRIDVSASGVPAAQWCADLKQLGIWVADYGSVQIRLVTHRHIGEAEVEKAVSAMGTLWQRYGASAKKRSA